MHFFHHSYFWFNYVVDLAILIGAIFGGIRGTLEFQKHRTKKRTDAEDAQIDTRVKEAVDVAVTKILTKVDDAVGKSVDEQFVTIVDSIDTVAKRVEEVHMETHNNGGSSMKDSVDRLERSVTQVLVNQDVTKAAFINQDEKIDDIKETQRECSINIGDLRVAVAAHIGAHVGLPEKGDRGDAGARGERGARGLTGDTGRQGDTGSTGETGDAGRTGDQGFIGNTGHVGDKGDTGRKGDTGDIGGVGPKGDAS